MSGMIAPRSGGCTIERSHGVPPYRQWAPLRYTLARIAASAIHRRLDPLLWSFALMFSSLTRAVVRAASISPIMTAVAAAAAAAQTSVILPGPSGRAHVTFEIRVPASVRNERLTGREYVI